MIDFQCNVDLIQLFDGCLILVQGFIVIVARLSMWEWPDSDMTWPDSISNGAWFQYYSGLIPIRQWSDSKVVVARFNYDGSLTLTWRWLVSWFCALSFTRISVVFFSILSICWLSCSIFNADMTIEHLSYFQCETTFAAVPISPYWLQTLIFRWYNLIRHPWFLFGSINALSVCKLSVHLINHSDQW